MLKQPVIVITILRALNISRSSLAWVMGFGIPQECDSDFANGSKFAPMKSRQPQWI